MTVSYLTSLIGLLFIYIFDTPIAYCQLKTLTASPVCIPEMESWIYSSKVVGQDYKIYVLLPPGYDTSRIDYPVLYMTDGDWNMTVAMNCFNMLRQDYQTREPLIVGIGYGDSMNQRSRDLNPTTGAAPFLAFIQQELIPFVKNKYRVNEEKALYGYSFGGMFTTYVLFEHAGLFAMVFIGAPGNNGNELVATAEKYFSKHTDLKAKVFVGVGAYEPEVVKNIKDFKAYLDKQKVKDLIVATAITPKAGHGAALAQVMQNAIAFGYCQKHTPILISPKELTQYIGMYSLPEDSSVKLKVYSENKALYWVKDGDQPSQLIPFAKHTFFMYENERWNFSFQEEAGKKFLIVNSPDSQVRLHRTQ